MSTKTSLLGSALLVASTVLGLAGRARAQTCGSDKDCPQSYSCVASGVVAVSTPACPPNADCAKLDADAGAAGTVIMTCEPKACTADADCGAGMVCHTESEISCSGGGYASACPANTKCDAGVVTYGSTCSTTITKLCAFKWQLPCNVDADCGDGFACKPDVAFACSGSGSGGGAGTSHGSSGPASTGTAGSGAPGAPGDAGSANLPAQVDGGGGESSCTTMSSFPGYCQPKATTCTTGADCPAAWKCMDVPTPVPVGIDVSVDGSAGVPAATGGGASHSGGPAIIADAATGGGTTGGGGGPAIGVDAGGTVTGGSVPGADAGGAKTCVSPLGGGYGYSLGGEASTTGAPPQASGTGAANGDDAGASPMSTSTKGGGANGPSASHAAASSAGGCSLAGGGGGAERASLLLLALVALRRARRRSR